VPYDVQTADPVADYLVRLSAESISPTAVERLIEEYTLELGNRADIHHERSPLAHESHCFRFETVLVDGSALWQFDFVVNGRHKESGVVIVVYVEGTRLA
jgi:hypothetical protein